MLSSMESWLRAVQLESVEGTVVVQKAQVKYSGLSQKLPTSLTRENWKSLWKLELPRWFSGNLFRFCECTWHSQNWVFKSNPTFQELLITLKAVGQHVVAKYTPIRTDGEIGKSVVVITSGTVGSESWKTDLLLKFNKTVLWIENHSFSPLFSLLFGGNFSASSLYHKHQFEWRFGGGVNSSGWLCVLWRTWREISIWMVQTQGRHFS